MRKILLSILLSISCIFVAAQSNCDSLLKNLYQTISVESDKAFLEKIYKSYDEIQQNRSSSQTGTSFSIPVPELGSLGFKDNYQTAKSLYTQYSGMEGKFLSDEERYRLTQMYTIPSDTKDARAKFLQCVEFTNNIQAIKLSFQSDNNVHLSFRLNSDDADSVKIRNVSYSDNLVLISENLKGQTISRKGTHSLEFKRTDTKKAYVNIDLERGTLKALEIPQTGKPVYYDSTYSETIVYRVSVNVDNNMLKITDPLHQVQSFTSFKQDPKYGQFALPIIALTYRLGFNPAEVIVKEIIFSPSKESKGGFEDNGTVLLPDGLLGISLLFKPESRIMSGSINVKVERKRKICISNCP